MVIWVEIDHDSYEKNLWLPQVNFVHLVGVDKKFALFLHNYGKCIVQLLYVKNCKVYSNYFVLLSRVT